jgi:hypothetical protein
VLRGEDLDLQLQLQLIRRNDAGTRRSLDFHRFGLHGTSEEEEKKKLHGIKERKEQKIINRGKKNNSHKGSMP